MLVDVDKRVVAFALDGRVQGACPIPGDKPLYVITQVGRILRFVARELLPSRGV